MNSHTTERFRKAYKELPAEVRKQAQQAYRLFMEDPNHPGLRFKSIHPTRPIYSVRVGLHYRAVGILERKDIIWYWVGSHAEYDKLLRVFKK